MIKSFNSLKELNEYFGTEEHAKMFRIIKYGKQYVIILKENNTDKKLKKKLDNIKK